MVLQPIVIPLYLHHASQLKHNKKNWRVTQNKMNQVTKLTIVTELETKNFDTFKEFIEWDKNENKKLIEEYELIDENGNHMANKGMNAGAYLYDILEMRGEWSIDLQFPNQNVPLIISA